MKFGLWEFTDENAVRKFGLELEKHVGEGQGKFGQRPTGRRELVENIVVLEEFEYLKNFGLKFEISTLLGQITNIRVFFDKLG